MNKVTLEQIGQAYLDWYQANNKASSAFEYMKYNVSDDTGNYDVGLYEHADDDFKDKSVKLTLSFTNAQNESFKAYNQLKELSAYYLTQQTT